MSRSARRQKIIGHPVQAFGVGVQAAADIARQPVQSQLLGHDREHSGQLRKRIGSRYDRRNR